MLSDFQPSCSGCTRPAQPATQCPLSTDHSTAQASTVDCSTERGRRPRLNAATLQAMAPRSRRGLAAARDTALAAVARAARGGASTASRGVALRMPAKPAPPPLAAIWHSHRHMLVPHSRAPTSTPASAFNHRGISSSPPLRDSGGGGGGDGGGGGGGGDGGDYGGGGGGGGRTRYRRGSAGGGRMPYNVYNDTDWFWYPVAFVFGGWLGCSIFFIYVYRPMCLMLDPGLEEKEKRWHKKQQKERVCVRREREEREREELLALDLK